LLYKILLASSSIFLYLPIGVLTADTITTVRSLILQIVKKRNRTCRKTHEDCRRLWTA